MKRDAEANKEPPVYTGKWNKASKEEVEEMFAKGAKPAYRFRVPKDKTITLPDAIRGDVSWNTDTLGDFIILRSDVSPVYNFCVAIDDALMKISHVIRAEEHLPNTLRQVRPGRVQQPRLSPPGRDVPPGPAFGRAGAAPAFLGIF